MTEGKITRYLRYIILILSILIIYSGKTIASNSIDSLQREIVGMDNDTNKVNILLKLAPQYFGTDTKQARKYCELASEISNDLSFLKGINEAYNQIAYSYLLENNYDSCQYFLDRSFEINKESKDLKSLANAYRTYARLYLEQDYHETSIEYYKKSLIIYQNLFDTAGIAKTYNSLGNAFKNIGSLDSAVVYYTESLELARKLENRRTEASILGNIASLYYKLNSYDLCIHYSFLSLKLFSEFNDLRRMAPCYTRIGMSYVNKEEYKKGRAYYDSALVICEAINYISETGNIKMNIGSLYADQMMFDTALNYYFDSYKIFNEINLVSGKVSALINIAYTHGKTNSFHKALLYYDTALILAKQINAGFNILQVYKNIQVVHLHSGNYKDAHRYLVKYSDLKDSLDRSKSFRKIRDYELKYEKEKNEASILKLQNENLNKDLDIEIRTNQRNIYLWTGVSVIMVGFLLFVFYRQKTIKDRQIKEQTIKRLEEEKKALAAKAIVEGQEEERKHIASELHDGIGVLLSTTKLQFSNIADKSPENKELIENAKKMLEQASGDIRKMSHRMMPGILTKLGLSEAIKDLFETLDELPDLEATTDFLGEERRLGENNEIMIFRIIQEISNNVIKHANANNLSLVFNYEPKTINIQVSDDGVGFDIEKAGEKKSIGLQSIQSRIDFMNGELNLESRPGKETMYFIQIPV